MTIKNVAFVVPKSNLADDMGTDRQTDRKIDTQILVN
jgi:hypothetical protein